MNRFLQAVRIVATAVPTWCGVVSAAAPILAGEIAKVMPNETGERVCAVVLTVGGVAGAVLTTIRRVTPVQKDQRGVLPPDQPQEGIR